MDNVFFYSTSINYLGEEVQEGVKTKWDER